MPCYLVTGGGGFIGSHLVRALLAEGHEVRVIDDFSTGRRQNLRGVEDAIALFEASICDEAALSRAMAGVDYCLHQAAIPSVPRSVRNPMASNRANVEGTLQVFLQARDHGVKRVVFASSSSVYGNAREMPLRETLPRGPISPYAITKAAGEMYAEVCTQLYGIELVGLRYFNVFGPRQDPDSPYSAVIPLFIKLFMAGQAPLIHGDGQQARDFTFVENVVRANLLAAQAPDKIAGIYNVACGGSTTVLDLAGRIAGILGSAIAPRHGEARPGDIRQSWADITKARESFGYAPVVTLDEGLAQTVEWIREEYPPA